MDWDKISKKEAKRRTGIIEKKEKSPIILYKTKHGYHAEIVKEVSVKKNFELRKKYWDDKNRLQISKERYKATGTGHDLLFDVKNGRWRKRVW